jgi:hypothetical protein
LHIVWYGGRCALGRAQIDPRPYSPEQAPRWLKPAIDHGDEAITHIIESGATGGRELTAEVCFG